MPLGGALKRVGAHVHRQHTSRPGGQLTCRQAVGAANLDDGVELPGKGNNVVSAAVTADQGEDQDWETLIQHIGTRFQARIRQQGQ